MMTLVFFLEEPSAEEMLKGMLPKILPDCVVPRFVVFEGKQDLDKQLERRMKLWKAPNSRFFCHARPRFRGLPGNQADPVGQM